MQGKIKTIFLYSTVFITGATILVIEILGTRVIGPFYGSTIFVWAALITVTLAALAIGYTVGGRIADARPSSPLLFFIIALAALSLSFTMKVDQGILTWTDTFGIQYGPLVAAAILFSLPALLLGAVTPFVIRLLAHLVERVGRTTGSVFALSTVGSIVGSLGGVFILLPRYSITTIFIGAATLLLILACIGFIIWRKEPGSMRFLGITIILASLAWLIPSMPISAEARAISIIHEAQGVYGNIKIIETGGLRCVAVDGATESCVTAQDYSVTPFFKELAGMINAHGGNSLLILGGGGGNIITGGISSSFNIDFVDIDPLVVELSKKYLGFNPGQNVQIHIDDARHFVQQTTEKYDVMFIDLARGTNQPLHMFSQEAFSLLNEHLKEGGLILFHVLGGMGDNDPSVTAILRTAKTVFPSVIQTTTNPDGNVSFFIHLSNDPSYQLSYQSQFGLVFPVSHVSELNGKIITDEKNNFDFLFSPKYEWLINSTKQYGGLRSVLVQ